LRAWITGGAGFIGCNLAARLLSLGHEPIVIDNCSRDLVRANLDWLRSQPNPGRLRVHEADVRDAEAMARLMKADRPELVVHLAAQVAVTTSVTDPRHDFEVNAGGTFNVLEAARTLDPSPVVIYASTNKVYGNLEHLRVAKTERGYALEDLPGGVSEAEPLDFHSPYGCSKGAADQYVIDYARIYGLRSVTMRQSCIYGTRQFGVEDQGWLAWFVIAAVTGRPITIYGDGYQVRDVLWVDDLLDLYLRAYERIDRVTGKALNVGGGPRFALCLLDSLEMMSRRLGREVPVSFGEWRPGDQRVYVSDTSRAEALLGWKPSTPPEEGITRLVEWVEGNRALFGN
jgi:CDP-paratose 2-epimerase